MLDIVRLFKNVKSLVSKNPNEIAFMEEMIDELQPFIDNHINGEHEYVYAMLEKNLEDFDRQIVTREFGVKLNINFNVPLEHEVDESVTWNIFIYKKGENWFVQDGAVKKPFNTEHERIDYINSLFVDH